MITIRRMVMPLLVAVGVGFIVGRLLDHYADEVDNGDDAEGHPAAE